MTMLAFLKEWAKAKWDNPDREDAKGVSPKLNWPSRRQRESDGNKGEAKLLD